MIVKSLLFFGQAATHACDGRCDKAWGHNTRSRVQISSNPNDYAYLADDELGEAPMDPGTTEGFDAKPIGAKEPGDINKWCVRECERGWLSSPGHPNATPDLPDFSERLYNITPHKRPASPIDAVAASLSEDQARELMKPLDTAQERMLEEIMTRITRRSS